MAGLALALEPRDEIAALARLHVSSPSGVLLGSADQEPPLAMPAAVEPPSPADLLLEPAALEVDEVELVETDEPFLDAIERAKADDGQDKRGKKKGAAPARPRQNVIEGALAGVGGPDYVRASAALATAEAQLPPLQLGGSGLSGVGLAGSIVAAAGWALAPWGASGERFTEHSPTESSGFVYRPTGSGGMEPAAMTFATHEDVPALTLTPEIHAAIERFSGPLAGDLDAPWATEVGNSVVVVFEPGLSSASVRVATGQPRSEMRSSGAAPDVGQSAPAAPAVTSVAPAEPIHSSQTGAAAGAAPPSLDRGSSGDSAAGSSSLDALVQRTPGHGEPLLQLAASETAHALRPVKSPGAADGTAIEVGPFAQTVVAPDVNAAPHPGNGRATQLEKAADAGPPAEAAQPRAAEAVPTLNAGKAHDNQVEKADIAGPLPPDIEAPTSNGGLFAQPGKAHENQAEKAIDAPGSARSIEGEAPEVILSALPGSRHGRVAEKGSGADLTARNGEAPDASVSANPGKGGEVQQGKAAERGPLAAQPPSLEAVPVSLSAQARDNWPEQAGHAGARPSDAALVAQPGKALENQAGKAFDAGPTVHSAEAKGPETESQMVKGGPAAHPGRAHENQVEKAVGAAAPVRTIEAQAPEVVAATPPGKSIDHVAEKDAADVRTAKADQRSFSEALPAARTQKPHETLQERETGASEASGGAQALMSDDGSAVHHGKAGEAQLAKATDANPQSLDTVSQALDGVSLVKPGAAQATHLDNAAHAGARARDVDVQDVKALVAAPVLLTQPSKSHGHASERDLAAAPPVEAARPPSDEVTVSQIGQSQQTPAGKVSAPVAAVLPALVEVTLVPHQGKAHEGEAGKEARDASPVAQPGEAHGKPEWKAVGPLPTTDPDFAFPTDIVPASQPGQAHDFETAAAIAPALALAKTIPGLKAHGGQDAAPAGHEASVPHAASESPDEVNGLQGGGRSDVSPPSIASMAPVAADIKPEGAHGQQDLQAGDRASSLAFTMKDMMSAAAPAAEHSERTGGAASSTTPVPVANFLAAWDASVLPPEAAKGRQADKAYEANELPGSTEASPLDPMQKGGPHHETSDIDFTHRHGGLEWLL